MRSMRIALRLFMLSGIFASLGFMLAISLPLSRRLRLKAIDADALVQFHLRGICRAMGLRIHLRGSLFPKGPFLMLANHVSYLDIIALGSLTPLAFMAKQELRDWPIIGFLAKRGSAVFVGRDCVSARVRALYRSKQLLARRSLCIFPEGTTTALTRPHPKHWHRGNIYLARHAARAAVCVGLHYADHEDLAWIDDQALLPHLFRVLSYPRLDLYVEAQSLPRTTEHSLQELAQLAHKTVSRLADAAAARSYEAAALHSFARPHHHASERHLRHWR